MQEDWFMYAKAFGGVNDSEDEQEPEQSDLDFLADIPPDLPGPNALELLDETGLPDEPEAAAEPEIPAEPLYSEAVVPIDQDDWRLYEPLESYGNDTTEPEPEPVLEYYADGRLTARAKGKGHPGLSRSRR
ncbi:hypothetical protein FRC06_008682 [Ceratobasidium sp. 370]|nr:hypothetical protein FRC06_008682 [Ceratobasidium sp. 370]